MYTYASLGEKNTFEPLEYALKSKIQLKFVKHFRMFTVPGVPFSNVHSFFAICVEISRMLMIFFRNFSKFAGKDQNLLDSQIS